MNSLISLTKDLQSKITTEAEEKKHNARKKEYFRGCCFFHVFLQGFMKSLSKNKVPACLINTLKARKDWRIGMTGNEALLTQMDELVKEGEYIWLQCINDK